MWVALFAANAVVPHAPVFVPPDFDARNANWWEVAYAYYREKHGEPPAMCRRRSRNWKNRSRRC